MSEPSDWTYDRRTKVIADELSRQRGFEPDQMVTPLVPIRDSVGGYWATPQQMQPGWTWCYSDAEWILRALDKYDAAEAAKAKEAA